MKDLNAFATITIESLRKLLNSHDMQKMFEYYSKTLIGNWDNSSARQKSFSEPIKCLHAHNSVINK